MEFSFITIIISILALLISLSTYSFNKRSQSQKQFAAFAEKLKQSFDNFMLCNHENYLTDFKYDISLILQNYTKDVLPDLETQKFYNQIQKNIGNEKNQLKTSYRELVTILMTLDNSKIGPHIRWINKVVNDLYKQKNEYYNNLFELYSTIYPYLRGAVEEKGFEKVLSNLFDNILQICVLNEVLLFYKTYFISTIQKTLININLFAVSAYFQQELLFTKVDKIITNNGIKEYISNQKTEGLTENFRVLIESYQKLKTETYNELLFECKTRKRKFYKKGGSHGQSYNF